MNFNYYQEKTRETAEYDKDIAVLYCGLGLIDEATEISGPLKKFLRKDFDKEELHRRIKGELGDVLWYLARLADEMDISLEEVAKSNLIKLAKRKKEGKIKGDGDFR